MEKDNNEEKIKQMIDDLIAKAKKASKEYLKLDQKTVDNIIKKMAMAGLENHMKLAIRYYIYKNRIKNIAIRIDVIEVYLQKKGYKINHIKQVL